MALPREILFATDILALRLVVSSLAAKVAELSGSPEATLDEMRARAVAASRTAKMAGLPDGDLPEMRRQLEELVNRFIPSVAP